MVDGIAAALAIEPAMPPEVELYDTMVAWDTTFSTVASLNIFPATVPQSP